MEEEEKLTKRERKKLAKEKKRKAREKSATLLSAKKYGVWLVVLAVVGFGGFKLVKWINTPTPETTEPVQVTDSDWIKGNREANLTLIEFADFQCPACAAYSSVVKRLSEEFPEDLRIVYRHFPLVSIHSNAIPAAKAAEAAGKQGKFWEMHDILFDKQSDWEGKGNPKDKFLEYARDLGLSDESFINDYESDEIEDKINEHLFAGNRLGVNSTPTFVLNDQIIQSPRGFDAFRDLIESRL